MIRHLSFISICLLLLGSCTSKSVDKSEIANNDSIKKYLELAGNSGIPLNKRVKYNNKAFSMIDLNRNDTVSISLVYKSAMNFYKLNEQNKLKINSNLMLKKALMSKDEYWTGLSYKVLGLYYMNKSENEKALECFFKAKKIMMQINEHKEVINILFNISLTQYFAGDFLGSNKTCFEIFKGQKKYKSKFKYGIVYNQIANNLSGLKQEEKAIEYYQRIDKKKVGLGLKTTIINNLSLSYIETRQYRKAYILLDSIIRNKELELITPNSYATALSLFGYSKLKMNNLNHLPKVFFIADKIFKKSNLLSGSNYNQMYLSMYYGKIKDTTNSILSAKKALKISRKFKNPTDILVCLGQLIKVDKKNASTLAEEYIKINDSMHVAERNFRDKFARIAYETDEITQEKDKAISQKWIITAIATTIIVIVLLIFIITRQRSKQKELCLLQEQQKANEEIYHLMLRHKAKEDEIRQNEKKRIALELHDGIMNKLSSTRLNLSVLKNKKDEKTVKRCLNYIEGLQQIESDIRTVSHDLNKDVFQTENSFIKILEDFVREQNKTSRTRFVLEVDKNIDWKSISSVIKMNLFRIIQEASQNINKYAKAQDAVITLMIDYPNICMAITDNGVGFDTTVITKGIGIQNMLVRVKSLNGKLSISSKTKGKTSINIAIPFA